jgi:hypothetical protein
MSIISEDPWLYVLFDEGKGWTLTVAVDAGGRRDVSLRLSEAEVSSARADRGFARRFAAEVKAHPERFAGRQLDPPVWPRAGGR